jgi:hypothetical protein
MARSASSARTAAREIFGMKDQLRDMLGRKAFDEIAALAKKRKRALGVLVSLTYEPEGRFAFRAVEALGVACDRVAESNGEAVRNILRRLYWLVLEESGGICLLAPAGMAEIVRHRPEEHADYAAIVTSLPKSMAAEDLPHFLPYILYSIGRLAPVGGRGVPAAIPDVAARLGDPDPQIRGMAVWCLLQAGRRDLVGARPELLADEEHVEIYEAGEMRVVPIRELAAGG